MTCNACCWAWWLAWDTSWKNLVFKPSFLLENGNVMHDSHELWCCLKWQHRMSSVVLHHLYSRSASSGDQWPVKKIWTARCGCRCLLTLITRKVKENVVATFLEGGYSCQQLQKYFPLMLTVADRCILLRSLSSLSCSRRAAFIASWVDDFGRFWLGTAVFFSTFLFDS